MNGNESSFFQALLRRRRERPETASRRRWATRRGFGYGVILVLVVWIMLSDLLADTDFDYEAFVATDGSIPLSSISIRIDGRPVAPDGGASPIAESRVTLGRYEPYAGERTARIETVRLHPRPATAIAAREVRHGEYGGRCFVVVRIVAGTVEVEDCRIESYYWLDTPSIPAGR